MKVLIPCAGMATRWHGDKPKQLVRLLGEPILHRTVRLLNENGIQPTIIVKDPRGVTFKVPKSYQAGARLDESREQADKVASSRHLWPKSDRVVILWGDVFYTRAALESILGFEGEWAMFARLGPSEVTGKDHKEPFGFSIAPSAQSTFDAAMSTCVEAAQAGTLVNWSGSWEIYKAAHGLLDTPWSELPAEAFEHLVPIDDATDDFDQPSDWDEWCLRYAEYSVEERIMHGMVP